MRNVNKVLMVAIAALTFNAAQATEVSTGAKAAGATFGAAVAMIASAGAAAPVLAILGYSAVAENVGGINNKQDDNTGVVGGTVSYDYTVCTYDGKTLSDDEFRQAAIAKGMYEKLSDTDKAFIDKIKCHSEHTAEAATATKFDHIFPRNILLMRPGNGILQDIAQNPF